MYSWLRKFYSFFRLLSLDLVTGVVSGFIFCSYFLKNKPETFHWVILPLSVWIIYTFDHILDGIKLKENAVLDRHKFFYKYRKAFITVLILVVLGNGYLIYTYLNPVLKISGGILGFLVLIYMLFNHYFTNKKHFYFYKEFVIAYLYTAGIWLIPLSLQGFLITTQTVLFFTFYLVIVIQNVLIYSFFEYDKDVILNQKTLPHFIGKEWTHSIMLFFGVLGIILAILLVIFFPKKIIFIAVLMIIQLILLSISVFLRYFSQKQRYGIVSDASLYIMALSATL